MKKPLLAILFTTTTIFASFTGTIIDANTKKLIINAEICDSKECVNSDKNGSFFLKSSENSCHIKQYGYRAYTYTNDTNSSTIKIKSIKIKALYLSFWGASNNSGTLKNLLKIIDESQINAVIVDVKNEYGSTSFLTSFKQANEYGAHENRTNRNISKFIQTMKERGVYTIARIVTFKDEIQASNNPQYALKRNDNGTIWRNSDNMAWVDPFDTRAHKYTIRIAEEAAKVGFDEINFDYIRFPAKKGLRYSKENTQENRIAAISQFLDTAKNSLQKYGVFISVDTYGNVCWSKDDNQIGQTVESLSKHADYLSPMLYPSGFSSGSFYFEHPAQHPYAVIYRSIKNIQDKIALNRIRPWLQYFKDYTSKRREYKRFEIQEQIRGAKNVNGWMMWSPSSKYHIEYLLP